MADHAYLPIFVSFMASDNPWVSTKCDKWINESIQICKYFMFLEGHMER